MSDTVISFTFARGGSKGIPRKNLREIGGVPLIGRAVTTGLECPLIDRVLVSTDDAEIASVARRYGAEVPWMRPAELASDEAPEWLSWRHAIESLDAAGELIDTFVSLPATAPLRSVDDVIRCIEEFREHDCDMVVTTRRAARHPSFNMVRLDDDGYAHLLMPVETSPARRQDAPAAYDLTTVAYVTTPRFIREAGGLFDGRVRAVEVDPVRAIDVDDELDLIVADALLPHLSERTA